MTCDKCITREATIAELIEQRNQLQNEADFHLSMCPVLLASREATIARLRGALEARGRRGHDWYCETRAHERMCREARERDAAQRAGGLYDGVNVPPYPCEHAIACDCGQDALTDALATPDPGRRDEPFTGKLPDEAKWWEAVEQAKEALREASYLLPVYVPYSAVIERMHKAIAALEALR